MTKTTCDTVRPEMKAYLDGMLSWLPAYRVRRHLLHCENCRRELTEVERIGKELHNMATDLRADGDKLDPLLRARILAAIPPDPSAPTHSTTPFRMQLGMTLGAVTATVLGAAIILSLHQFHGLADYVPRSATAKGSDSGRENYRATASATLSANQVAGDIPPAAGESRAVPAAADPPGGMRSSEPSGRYGRAQGAGAALVDGHPVAEGSPAAILSGQDGKVSASVDSEMKAADSGFATGAVYEPHTFTTHNLKQGVILVRQAVDSFQGSVIKQSGTTDANTVELTISIPSSLSAAFVGAIPAISSGMLRAQTSLSKVSRHANGAAVGNSRADMIEQVNTKAAAELKPQSPRVAASSGRVQNRPASVPNQSNDGTRKAVSKPNTTVTLASPGLAATTTITIVLVKGQ